MLFVLFQKEFFSKSVLRRSTYQTEGHRLAFYDSLHLKYQNSRGVSNGDERKCYGKNAGCKITQD